MGHERLLLILTIYERYIAESAVAGCRAALSQSFEHGNEEPVRVMVARGQLQRVGAAIS